jgi:hypothetical protein
LTSVSVTDAVMIAAGAVVPFVGTESAKLLSFSDAVDNSRHSPAENAIATRPTPAIEPAPDLRKA